ncbi:MAG: pyrroline-5-carboxylate reductase [Spirochaetaceae bacterium]|nr:MAG: pyrroline-5-carboxylate reductase [Spirochaetaceae bacterium]
MVKSIGFVGGGNMGFALARTITERFPGAAINVFDINGDRLALFEQELPEVRTVDGPRELAEASEVMFLSVKPQDIQPVLEAIWDTERLLISIAAGVPIKRIEGVCSRARVVRVMPNTPCLVGAMAAGYAFGSRIRPPDRELVRQLLGAAGYAAEVEEQLLDGVTGLSGSGPAFVARLIEAFIAAGKGLGLEPEVARNLSIQTFLGTAKLLADTGMDPQKLVDLVSSPNGTTVAGLQVLETSDYAQVISGTIQAAAVRSRELGR